MESAWPEPVERVAAFLRAAGAEARLEQLDGAASSSHEAAESIGCAAEQVVEAACYVCDDGRTVVVLLPGGRRADPGKIAEATGARRARAAGAAETLEATGFPQDAIAPFGLARVELLLAEQTLLARSVVWVGGGSDSHKVALAPLELLRLTRAEPVDVLQESA